MTTTIEYDNDMFEASFAKRFGKNSLIDLTQKPKVGAAGTFIATPAETLNVALGIGGIKKGAIVEFYGPNSSGKTTLGLEVLQMVQQVSKRPVMVIDAEQAFDIEYCRSIGIQIEGGMCKFNQCTETETVLNMVEHACKSGVGAVLVDSIPALTPRAQLEDLDVTDSRMGGNAKLLSDGLKRIKTASMGSGTIVIFINQIRSKVGTAAAYGNPETTPGGHALPFFADLRVRTSIDQTPDYLVADKKTGEIRGTRIKATVIKVKWAPPLRVAYYDIIFGSGIDQLGSVFDAGVNKGVIKQAGSWYSFHGKQMAQGRNGCRTLLESNPELLSEIREAIWSPDELQ